MRGKSNFCTQELSSPSMSRLNGNLLKAVNQSADNSNTSSFMWCLLNLNLIMAMKSMIMDFLLLASWWQKLEPSLIPSREFPLVGEKLVKIIIIFIMRIGTYSCGVREKQWKMWTSGPTSGWSCRAWSTRGWRLAPVWFSYVSEAASYQLRIQNHRWE